MDLRIQWCLFTILMQFTLSSLEESRMWNSQPIFPQMQIPENALSARRSIVRRKIVLYHNFFRTKVRPSASNMLLMTWHPTAARQAQQYAESCFFLVHNQAEHRKVAHLDKCGQNIFVSSKKVTWFQVIKSWFMEYKLFRYGAPVRNLTEVGHYTQIVWATTHKVGCGLALCPGGPWKKFYNYVCHYCPAGNIAPRIEFPYKTGPPCGDCPNSCVSNSLCTNTCPVKDAYSNCGQLRKRIDVCRTGYCNATCSCQNKLYSEYPWQ